MRKRGGRGQGRSAAEPDVILQVVIGAGDARRLMRLAGAAGLTAEACAASIVAEVLAADATCHEGTPDVGWDQAKWDRAAKAAPAPSRPDGGQLQ